MNDSGIALQIGVLTIRWYGVLICAGMLIGIFLARNLAKKRGLNCDEVYNLALVILPAAVIGARLYYVAFSWDVYVDNPINALKIWRGGLAIHGGFLAALIATYIYLKIRKQTFLSWADVFVPSLALGQAIGRWGNYFNGEAYGRQTDLPWAIFVDGAYHHPTFLYESLWNAGVFVFLLWLFNKEKRSGTVFAFYLMCYSFGRFWIEGLRMDSLMLFDTIRVAQLVSIILFMCGAVLLWWLRTQTKQHDVSNKKKKKQQ